MSQTHICASLNQDISVPSVMLASQSYHPKLWFERLNNISLNGGLQVSLISASIGSPIEITLWKAYDLSLKSADLMNF